MTLDELLERIKFLDPYYKRANELESQIEWYRQNDLMKTGIIQKLLEAQIPISDPNFVLPINSSLDIAPLFLNHPLLSKAILSVTEGSYQATTLKEIDRFVDWAMVNTLPYVDDLHECGKFATGLVGKFCNVPGWWDTPIGILSLGSHQMCIGVAFEDDTLTKLIGFILEPQTKERWTLDAITQPCWWVYLP